MMNSLEKRIGYSFKNPLLLERALTHSSYANESKDKLESNERLEFLGDSVLGVIVSLDLYEHFTELPEGELTKLRASLVCEKSLYNFAMSINLGDEIKLGRGEQHTGGGKRPSILADAFEALIAAIYIDSGSEDATDFVLRFVRESLEQQKPKAFNDYKTQLQEIVQQNPSETVEYAVVGESGPDHDKTFNVEVRLNSNIIGTGRGHSKKQAEQKAAKEALKLMGEI